MVLLFRDSFPPWGSCGARLSPPVCLITGLIPALSPLRPGSLLLLTLPA